MADGVDKDQAREIVRAALKDRQRRKKGSAGGQSGQTDEVTLADDMCDDFEITCAGKMSCKTMQAFFTFSKKPQAQKNSTAKKTQANFHEKNSKNTKIGQQFETFA